MRLAALLDLARTLGIDRLDAQVLLARRLGRPRSWLLAHDDDEIDPAARTDVLGCFERRRAGEPLAYLTGEKEFHGLSLAVSPAVLVPRPDTETLVDWALELLPPGTTAAVADLGTGSGAVAVAIATRRPSATVTATDASAAALAVAAGNAARHGRRITLSHGHWWQAVAGQRFDLVVSNPPYVAAGDPHLAALRHEPLQALAAGADGLDAIREIVAGAAGHLNPGGRLLLEHGHDQAAAVRRLLSTAGFGQIESRRDLAGHARCSGGSRPGGTGTPAA